MATSRRSAATDAEAEITGKVVGVHLSPEHSFSKDAVEVIDLVAGHGVAGDAHAGSTVQHLSRVARDPEQPNLRQVHLIHAELFEELAAEGFDIRPGDLGENITTSGLDLLPLPVGTHLHIGEVVLTMTGLRNPCSQIDALAPGLMKRLVQRQQGRVQFLAGVMAIVTVGGRIAGGSHIDVELPRGPHRRLQRV